MTTQEQQPAQPAQPPASRPATLAASAEPGSAIQGTPLKLCHFCGGEWPEGQGDAVQKWNWLATRASAPVAGEAQADDLNKKLFEAAILDLAAISEHLGLDPDEGGAEPIIGAIDELRRERDSWVNAQRAAAGEAAPQASPAADGRDAEDAARKTAGNIQEPMNGDGWHVVWWNESMRLMLPDGSRLDRFQGYRNGTMQLTIKTGTAIAAQQGEGGK